MSFYSLPDARGVFCDAAVMTTDGVLVFASLWGRDTVIQGLLGNLQLPLVDGGMNRIRLARTDSDQPLAPEWIQGGARLPNVDLYDKTTGRYPKQPGDSVVGSLVHLFLFHKDVQDQGCGYVLTKDSTTDGQSLLWQRFKQMQTLPLLDDWQPIVMDELHQAGTIQPLTCVGNVRGWHINFADQDAFDAHITSLLRANTLPLPSRNSL